MEYDVVVIGAGPAGLATAIRLKQLCLQHSIDLTVAVLDKASSVGAHNLSGCVMDPSGLDELIPTWKTLNFPVSIQVSQDKLYLLNQSKAFSLPIPTAWANSGNYIISLAQMCAKLAEYAEALGVEIYPGFAACQVLYADDGAVVGVVTGEMGVLRNGEHGPNYQAGIEISARQIVLAEGCKGSLTREIIKQFDLARDAALKTFGLGIKEVWQIDPKVHKAGTVAHYVGYPLGNQAYGGGFVYHMADNLVSVGLVTALDYANPYLSPFEEFQKFKLHPKICRLLQGGQRIEYGARSVDESGIQSLPKLTFPGGVIVGDSAGFLNVAKIKGVHYAIKSGMLAADAIVQTLQAGNKQAHTYQDKVYASVIYTDLYAVRNIRPAFSLGLYLGLIYAGIDHYIFRGKAPWTFKRQRGDHQKLLPKTQCAPIIYPKADGVITFDRLSSTHLANLSYNEDQPCHLKLTNASTPIEVNLAEYGAPETCYCPAAVYEIVEDAQKTPTLKINATNCLQCKACEIKDPTQNITFTPPEGGNGPQYGYM